MYEKLVPQLAVFPLRPIRRPGPACTCVNGASCGRIGKHPDGSLKHADGRQLLCHRSGVFVVDIDDEAANDLLSDMGEIPPTLTVASARSRTSR
jgi:hypothetical protein